MMPAGGSVRRRLAVVALMSCAPAAPVLASGLGTTVSVILGLFAAALAINVVLVAVASERSHRGEDASSIKDARAIANQCVHIFDVLGGFIAKVGKASAGGAESAEDAAGAGGAESAEDSAHRALDQLAARTRLLVTQYRRYLEPATLEALRYVEMEILDAQLRKKTPASLVLTIGKAMWELDRGIRGVDDPELAAMRRRI
ncbi:MAG: hypothetical protein EB832_00180 [Thaumarchaeota archaeon S14]|nr:MAG: hypothetical protein EB832_00180 [Thaumarchaeota archaeon S14]